MTLAQGGQTGSAGGYNEVIVRAASVEAHLPRAVLGFFYVANVTTREDAAAQARRTTAMADALALKAMLARAALTTRQPRLVAQMPRSTL